MPARSPTTHCSTGWSFTSCSSSHAEHWQAGRRPLRSTARAGFAATSLDDIAAEAGITRVILYRHFESKADLYRAVLDRACTRLAETVGAGDYGDDAIPALVHAAAADPGAFRLLFPPRRQGAAVP
jgi:AcrR family transcriptional regulator